jgi:hypothetical protein
LSSFDNASGSPSSYSTRITRPSQCACAAAAPSGGRAATA